MHSEKIFEKTGSPFVEFRPGFRWIKISDEDIYPHGLFQHPASHRAEWHCNALSEKLQSEPY